MGDTQAFFTFGFAGCVFSPLITGHVRSLIHRDDRPLISGNFQCGLRNCSRGELTSIAVDSPEDILIRT